MPTYQYACTECGHSFEQVQSFSDDSLTVCPVCEGRLRKVYNAVGVVFKGSGFYRNDSRSPSGSESSSGDTSKSDSTSSGEKKSDKPAEKKSDPAPAKKADSKPAASSSSSSSSSSSTS